jgi:hypothetical protein
MHRTGCDSTPARPHCSPTTFGVADWRDRPNWPRHELSIARHTGPRRCLALSGRRRSRARCGHTAPSHRIDPMPMWSQAAAGTAVEINVVTLDRPVLSSCGDRGGKFMKSVGIREAKAQLSGSPGLRRREKRRSSRAMANRSQGATTTSLRSCTIHREGHRLRQAATGVGVRCLLSRSSLPPIR